MPALVTLLLAGLALRLTIAYVLFPESGFATDISSFVSWALTLADVGPGGFYASAGFADYPPGYLYVLWIVGIASNALGPFAGGDASGVATALIKVPPMLADVVLSLVLYRLVRGWAATGATGRADPPDARADRLGLVAAAIYLFNPVTWYDSALWGQTDAIGALVMLLGVAFLVRDRPEAAAVAAVVAGLVKPQFGVVLGPLVAAVLLRRHILDRSAARSATGSVDEATDERPGGAVATTLRRVARDRGPIRLATSAVAGAVVFYALVLPFGLDLRGFLELISKTAGGYPYLSVNAFNPWALLGAGGVPPIAFSFPAPWPPDTVPLLGPLTGVVVGAGLLLVGFLGGLMRLLVRDDRRSIVLVAVYLCLAFFILPTRVHERYLFPVFAFLPVLAVADRRWLWATVALSIGSFLNLHGVLTVDIWGTPNVVGLPLGDLSRSLTGIVASVVLQTAVFVFAAWQLRPAAAWRRDPLAAIPRLARKGRRGRPSAGPVPSPPSVPARTATEPSRVDAQVGREQSLGNGQDARAGAMPAGSAGSAGPAGSAGSVRPSGPSVSSRESSDALAPGASTTTDEGQEAWVATGPLSWILERSRVSPTRRDRSSTLDREPGGRLDRLDLLVVLLVFLSALTMRTWRLAEPYDMHFDEVYHARTATEFLQHWRYDMRHDIYEYTHPHLAKYAIAAGIVAFGNDRVVGQADLGAPVADAAIEQRWSPDDDAARRNGDRLYVATGDEVRAYDLRDRTFVGSIAFAAVVAAVDPAGHELYMADAGGAVAALSTRAFDEVRAGRAPADALQPRPVGSFGAPPGGAGGLLVAEGSLVGLLEGGRVASIDPVSGERTGEAEVAGAADAATLASADRVVVDLALVEDVAAEAEALATALADDAIRIEGLLAGDEGTVTVDAFLDDDTTTEVQELIDDGTLPAVSIRSGPAVAVAGSDGVTFLDARSLDTLTTVDTEVPTTGLALVENLDDPTFYVAAGERIELIPVRDDSGPAAGGFVDMPGEVVRVRWDGPSNLVHVEGLTADGSATTVYVVEPHANAVFADARLPFSPAALVLDIQPERPSDDRQDLLAFDGQGRVAAVDIGSHAFSWRLPGVIAGAFTTALLYLLGRSLFRRRSIALMAAALALVEGMFFANARIAMNDTYVTAFIVAALTVFAPLYLGRWRRPLAVALALPAVGVLLGLAIASKWVGAYAIGLVLLLILLRSALGRLVALGGMVLLTGVLGYSGIRANPDVADPRLNLLFLILMLVLTVLLAAAIVVRPVRFSLEELRFSVIAPAALGAVLGLAAIILGPGLPADGPVSGERLVMAGTVLLFVGAGSYVVTWFAARFGIGPLAPAAAGHESRASPAPRGWLRPGWAFGIPWSYAIVCLTAIPLLVYLASYVPWIALGNRWFEGVPAGHTGQLFLDLTRDMYEYHDNLRATHAASSPWWAWPLDLKPVWFYQDSFAGSTTGAIYDAGNLVVFWLALPAVAFCAWQAWRRRSLALTLVVIAIACLWLPWARIDRATFQYHVFTSLPFAILALAYFLGELWHGPSSRTWLLARAAAAVAIVGPPILWLLRAPLLCTLAGTRIVHPDGIACGPITRQVSISEAALVAFVLLLVGIGLLAWQVRSLSSGANVAVRLPGAARRLELPPVATMLFIVGVIAAAVPFVWVVFGQQPVLTLQVRAEEWALVALVLLAGPAYLVFRARDSRRFVVAALGCAALWFVAWYPHISGLPLPTTLSQAYLAFLSTYNYDFQFAVNTDAPYDGPLLDTNVALVVALVALVTLGSMSIARAWLGATRPPRGAIAGSAGRPR